LSMILFMGLVFASVHLITPVNINVKPLETIKISPVGPGHEVVLKFQRQTGENIFWDNIRVINQIDPDWKIVTYSDHDYLYCLIDVPKNKQSGEYTFEFLVSDNEALIEPEIAIVKLFVTYDQNDLIEVIPFGKEPEFFADTDNNATFKIKNKALSTARYAVTSEIVNFPSYGRKTLVHELKAGETKEINVPFKVPEEGRYILKVHIWSEDNPTISQDIHTVVWVKPTIRSKLRSIGRGFPLIPITMAPFYALLGLFGV